MKRNTIIALLTILAVSLCCAAFSFAISADAENIPLPDSANKEEAVLSQNESQAILAKTSEQWSEQYSIMLDYRVDNDRNHDIHSFYHSLKDVVADLGNGLYYPSYEVYAENSPTVIFGGRGYYDEETGELDGYYAIQIQAVIGQEGRLFWIEEGITKEDWMYDPEAEQYESLGTTFYISEYHEVIGGYFVEGDLNGSHYSFIAENAEEAKLIIDSLEKSE